MPIKEAWIKLMARCRAIPIEAESAQTRVRLQVGLNAIRIERKHATHDLWAKHRDPDATSEDTLAAYERLERLLAAEEIMLGQRTAVPSQLQRMVGAIALSRRSTAIT